MKQRKVLTLLGALVLAVVVAASTTASASSPRRLKSDSTRGITNDSIKVGGLGYAQFYADSATGAQARFKRENDAGGVFGRKINFIGFQDDGSDPNQNLDQGKKLVQQDQVFAVVPTITPFLGAGQFFAQNKVPFIGWGIASAFCGNPFGFGFTGCLTPNPPTNTANTWGVLMNKYFKGNVKGKTAAVIAEDNDSGRSGVKEIAAAAASGGFKVVYQKNPIPPPPAAVADFTPYANDVLKSNNGNAPDVVFVVTAFSNVTGLSNKLLDLGYKGVLTNAVGYDPRLVSSFKGSTVFIQFNSFETAQQGNTAMQQIINDIKAVKPDASLTQAELAGYLSADMFIAALKKTGKNLTVEKFLKASNGNFSWQLKGVTGVAKFPGAHKDPTPCGSLVQSNGSSYDIPVPFLCGKVIKVK